MQRLRRRRDDDPPGQRARGLSGLDAIWVGQCDCGQTTFAATGDAKAVQAFFDALGSDAELTLGSQSRDGSGHETA